MALSTEIPLLPHMRGAHGGRHYVNVHKVGATGDGTVDDSPSIQAAIDGLPDSRKSPDLYGGTVYFPAGTYRLTRTLEVPARVTLIAEHPTRVHLAADGVTDGPALRVWGDYVRLEGLQLRCGGPGIEWHGAGGATMVNCDVWAEGTPLTLTRGSAGMFHNVSLKGGDWAMVFNDAGCVSLTGITVEGTRHGGVRVMGGDAITFQGLTTRGDGRALSVEHRAGVVLLGLVAEGKGAEAVYCCAGALIYGAALSAPGYRHVLVDEGGDGARLAGPDVGLYTGQATILAEEVRAEETRRFDEVRVDCGGVGSGAFAADIGFDDDSSIYGDTLSNVNLDHSYITGSPAPRAVYLTERSGSHVKYAFAMNPHKRGKGFRVRLHLNEPYFREPGKRVFMVKINGELKAERIDLFKQVNAKFTPVVLEFDRIQTSNGKIEIELLGHKQPNGKRSSCTVSGIEILRIPE